MLPIEIVITAVSDSMILYGYSQESRINGVWSVIRNFYFI